MGLNTTCRLESLDEHDIMTYSRTFEFMRFFNDKSIHEHNIATQNDIQTHTIIL